jgi:hypothetical protein
MTNLITELASRKGKPCNICDEMHSSQNRCRYERLATKIVKLLEANSFIPQLIQHNKESTEIATHFQSLLKKADQAHTILMEVLSRHGDMGEKIKIEYLEKLNTWADQHSSQDTLDQRGPSSPENSTPSETNDKPSINQESGESSQ